MLSIIPPTIFFALFKFKIKKIASNEMAGDENYLNSSSASSEEEEACSENSTISQSAPGMNTTRLIIQKMVLGNFKSYAGEREIGPFHKVSIQNVYHVNNW